MSYNYSSVSTMDQSSSFFGNNELTGSKDLMGYIFQMAQRSRNMPNTKSFSKQPDFLVYSQRLEDEIKRTSTTLKKLVEMTTRTTLFNSEDAKINELISNVKQGISGIQNKLTYLQNHNDLIYSKQSEKLSKNILDILNLRFMETAKEFKDTLEKRTKTIKQFKEKESFYSLTGSQSSEVRSRRNNKKEAAFLKKGAKGLDPEESIGAQGYSEDHAQGSAVAQEGYDLEYLKRKQDSVKGIQKTMEDVVGIFQRISSMVQMHEVMIERIDKDMDDSLKNVERGKKNLVNIYKVISSNRRLIISVFIFLMVFATIYILII